MPAMKQDDIALAGAGSTAPGDPVVATKSAVPRPSLLSRIQARVGRRLLSLIGRKLFGFKFEFHGLEHVPAGEPVIVAAAPHRGWIDSFLIIMALPPSPRVYYLGSAQAMFNRWWKRAILGLMGGVVPVSSLGQLNREGLETSLEILSAGGSLGVFPEGWGHLDDDPTQIGEFKRGVAFLAQRSGRRVLPVGLAGSQQLWRGKTLLLQVGPLLDPPAPSAGRAEQQAFADRLRTAIQAVAPAPPAEAEGAGRTWQWLTKLLG
jgi:1-acyl-sn-glycerol-3-phosphate acyltransferase